MHRGHSSFSNRLEQNHKDDLREATSRTNLRGQKLFVVVKCGPDLAHGLMAENSVDGSDGGSVLSFLRPTVKR